ASRYIEDLPRQPNGCPSAEVCSSICRRNYRAAFRRTSQRGVHSDCLCEFAYWSKRDLGNGLRRGKPTSGHFAEVDFVDATLVTGCFADCVHLLCVCEWSDGAANLHAFAGHRKAGCVPAVQRNEQRALLEQRRLAIDFLIVHEREPRALFHQLYRK